MKKLVISLMVLLFLAGIGGNLIVSNPAYAYVETSITGEYWYQPYRGNDASWYIQSVEAISTVTTSLDFSTACPDIDLYIIQYDDLTLAKTATATWHCTLGTVTANNTTMERNTDPSSSTAEDMIVILVDFTFM